MSVKDFKALTLYSSFEQIERLESYLQDLQKWADLNDDQYSRIQLAINEAVTNAIIHGNKKDPSKKIEIKTTLVDQTLKLSVQDEGSGFDPAAQPNPLDEQNLLNTSGRGLFIIKQYTDKLEFAHNASQLILYFSLD